MMQIRERLFNASRFSFTSIRIPSLLPNDVGNEPLLWHEGKSRRCTLGVIDCD
jgi:hypothetical protein